MVEPERAGVVWRKSSLSESGQCVEVAYNALSRSVTLRHSQDPSGPMLTFTWGEWLAFIGGVHNREFDEFDPPSGPSTTA